MSALSVRTDKSGLSQMFERTVPATTAGGYIITTKSVRYSQPFSGKELRFVESAVRTVFSAELSHLLAEAELLFV